MKTRDELKKSAIRTLETEYEAIKKLVDFIDDDFASCVIRIYESKGRVVLTGIGKSAIIANKLVATLNSTGTAAIFMHAADAIHGDLGSIRKDDIVICISKSGNTPEIKVLVPLIKNMGNTLVALVGNKDSFLAQRADLILNCYVEKEACPNNLAPTTSTTAQLAMGDALAVALLEHRGFTSEDFAAYHPGGALGKMLYLKVEDIIAGGVFPSVNSTDSIKTVILEISSKRLGVTAVLENEKLVGVITDGDLRRMLEQNTDFGVLQAKDIMNKKPKLVEKVMLAADAMKLMKEYNISQLLVVDNQNYIGVIHIHDLVKEGIV